jgi:hypothetical protein
MHKSIRARSAFTVGLLILISFITPIIGGNSASGIDITGEYDCAFDSDGAPTGAKYVIEDVSGVLTIHSGSYCYGEIVIPQGVEAIGVNAFSGSGIEKVVIPTSVRAIYESAFQGITSLTAVEFSNGDTEIGKSAFLGCSGLTSINLKSGKKNIGETAFYNSGLTSINFGSGVESIGISAFVGTSLSSVVFPSSLKSIGNNAFNSISALSSVAFGGGEETLGTAAFQSTSIHTLILPSTLTVIPEDAFRDNYQLTSVKIPSGVLTIESFAFYGNYNLRELDLGNTVQIIKERAFYAADLREVTFPNSLIEIELLAFASNTNLREVRLGFGLQTIRTSAFQSTDVRDLHIPSSITTLEADAFLSTNLQNLSISESATGISQQAFTTVGTGYPQYNANLYMCQLEHYLSWGEVQTALPNTFSTLIWVGRETTHTDSNGDTRLFFCGVPSAPKISSATEAGPNSANIRVQQSIISGGSDVTAIRIETSDGSFSQTFANNGNTTYSVNGLKSATTYSFKAFSINSKGISLPSGTSTSITTAKIVSEAEAIALQREAERLRQIEISKSRDTLLTNVKNRMAFTLTDLQKSDFDGVNKDNFTKILKEIDKRVVAKQPSIELIQMAIKYVVVVEDVSKIEESGKKMYANTLVDVGLISASSKNRTQIFYLVKQAPAIFRKDEDSLVLLISRIEMAIKERSERLAELRMQMEVRKSVT